MGSQGKQLLLMCEFYLLPPLFLAFDCNISYVQEPSYMHTQSLTASQCAIPASEQSVHYCVQHPINMDK